jgi:DNA-binding PadR family transcriptional regulator
MAKLGRWQREILTLLEAHGPQDGEALTFLATNGQADKETHFLCTRALKQLGKRGLIAHGDYRARQVYRLTAAGVARLEDDPWFAQKGDPTP